MTKYCNKVKEFITANVTGRTAKELVEMVNAGFGEGLFTENKMKSYKKNNRLKSETPKHIKRGLPTELYSQKIIDYIKDNHEGLGPKDMAERLNEVFDKFYTPIQLKSYYGNHKINSGTTGYFAKGHIPDNKGMIGYCAPGSEKGWFKKGHAPVNHRPIGSERVEVKDGYTLVKTEEPNVWELKHKVLWELKNGTVPKGHVLTFLDGNNSNIKIENLALVSMAESLMLTRRNLRSEHPELTNTGILIAKVNIARIKAKKREDK